MEVYQKLIHAAKDISRKSLCPRSGNHCGAVLLTRDGKLYSGISVEGKTGTVCAEANALAAAVADGQRKFTALAVYSDICRPVCANCVDLLSSFGDMWIICGSGDENPVSSPLSRIKREAAASE